MIRVTCPYCGRSIKAPDDAAGKTGKCPACTRTFTVSNASSAPRATSSIGRASDEGLVSHPQEVEQHSPVRSTDSHFQSPIGSEFISRNLMPGERVIAVARIHPVMVVASTVLVAAGLLLVLAGVAAGHAAPGLLWAGIAIMLFAGAHGLAVLVERLSTEFSCTDRRLLIKSGLMVTRLREMPLAKVEALSVEQGPLGRACGYGTLVFKGSGGTRRTCKNVDGMVDFYRRVQEQVAIAQGRN